MVRDLVEARLERERDGHLLAVRHDLGLRHERGRRILAGRLLEAHAHYRSGGKRDSVSIHDNAGDFGHFNGH
jgi:hypothetical protein